MTPPSNRSLYPGLPTVRALNASQVVLAIYEALSRGAMGKVLECLDEHVRWELVGPPALPFAGTYHGHVGVSRFCGLLSKAVGNPRWAMPELHTAGEHVTAVGALRGVTAGGLVDVSAVHLWELRDGRVQRMRAVLDTARLLEVLEAPEMKMVGG